MLYFIRKNLLAPNSNLFTSGLEDVVKATSELEQGKPGFVGEKYDCEKHDK